MSELIIRDLRNVIGDLEIPEIYQEIIDTVADLDGCWLAGGAALSLYMRDLSDVKDWDLFFDSVEAKEAAAEEFIRLGYSLSQSRSDWSANYFKNENQIQFIDFRNFEGPEDIFSGFDISVCCFAVEGNTMVYTEQARQDVENRVMNFLTTDHPVICLKRIARYGAKGFKPTTQFALDFINEIRGVRTRPSNPPRIVNENGDVMDVDPRENDFDDRENETPYIPINFANITRQEQQADGS